MSDKFPAFNPSAQPPSGTPKRRRATFTGLSGNEMWCVNQLGFEPGDLVIGNSVYSMGLLGGIRSMGRSVLGGELKQVTGMISEGRRLTLSRLEGEMAERHGQGVTGVTSEVIAHSGNIEFLAVGSTLHHHDTPRTPFSSSSDAQQLFCQVDAGYLPSRFVFGNVAYSMGITGGIFGALRSMGRGEVKEYSRIFNTTRHLALTRIEDNARASGANSVVNIQTTILPFSSAHEMLVVGTASHCKHSSGDNVITSALNAEELWSVTQLGYEPVKYMLGTSVYSLGVVGGVKTAFKNLVKGEISDLTTLIYDARENALQQLDRQATEAGADDVIGIHTHLYHLGNGIIEFLATGTAVRKVAGISTRSEQLPPQAFIRSRDTFFDVAGLGVTVSD